MAELIVPDWPAPKRVRAAMALRGTDPATLELPAAPRWLKQVHGTRAVHLSDSLEAAEPEADASWTQEPGIVCVVKSADCLPVLFCEDAGSLVAAAHAGWRGLAAGVLEATVRALPVAPASLLAWFGAAIGPASFEVGAEVREAFAMRDPEAARHFRPRDSASGNPEKFLADLYGLARQRLASIGVTRTFGGGLDTFDDAQRFHSYRRDGAHAGRMATLIWLER
jgi:hypothetical protein